MIIVDKLYKGFNGIQVLKGISTTFKPGKTSLIIGQSGTFDNWIQSSVYRNILQFKVATQFGKTVLSPVTQVRNVSSASMFPLANGHIGGRASVTDSIKMVVDDIFGAGKVIDEGKFIKNLENKIRLGVIDENIVASEPTKKQQQRQRQQQQQHRSNIQQQQQQ